MRRKRYYSEDDPEIGVTPSQLKRLGKAKQLTYMRYWFFSNFEDPANETPYNSAEGGYQYIWGGPYDAADELSDEFGGLISEERIREAVEEIESNGITDWAPGRHHPEHDRAWDESDFEERSDTEPELEIETALRKLELGNSPAYGSTHETELRSGILDKLDRLDELLQPVLPVHGGIGHNNPPTEEELPSEPLAEIRDASAIIREELEKPHPDAIAVAKATLRLHKATSWFKPKLNTAAESFAKAFGEATGKASGLAVVGGISYVAATTYPPAAKLITDIVSKAAQWLHQITLPF